MKEEEETQHSFKTFSWVLINKANNIIFSIKELLANTKSSIEI